VHFKLSHPVIGRAFLFRIAAIRASSIALDLASVANEVKQPRELETIGLLRYARNDGECFSLAFKNFFLPLHP